MSGLDVLSTGQCVKGVEFEVKLSGRLIPLSPSTPLPLPLTDRTTASAGGVDEGG